MILITRLSLNFHFLLLQCQRFTLSRKQAQPQIKEESLKTDSDTLPHIGNVLGHGFEMRRGVVTLGDKDVVVLAR